MKLDVSPDEDQQRTSLHVEDTEYFVSVFTKNQPRRTKMLILCSGCEWLTAQSVVNIPMVLRLHDGNEHGHNVIDLAITQGQYYTYDRLYTVDLSNSGHK